MARAPRSARDTICVSGHVPAPPSEVFDFLSDLGNHWVIADRFIEVVQLDREAGGAVIGGRVRMYGPLGVRRTATTRVTGQQRPTTMTGTAVFGGGGTRARVTWNFTADGDGTTVRLVAKVERAGALDRLLLALGGRAWFTARLAAILATLADRFRREAVG